MRIGFDYIATIGGGGNNVYSKNLIDSIIHTDCENQYFLYVYVHDFLRGRFRQKKLNNVHWRPAYFSSLGLPIPSSLIRWLNTVAIRFWEKLGRLDVFHFTNPLNFAGGLKKTVVTIHDLSSFHNSGWTKEGSQKFLSGKMKEMLSDSSVIIAVSEYTKQDIINIFGTSPEKIKVVHEAADSDGFYPDLDREHLKEKFNLTDYILYVGQFQPRKNILNILGAYSQLSQDLKNKYPLVLVGSARDKDYSDLVSQTIVRLDLSHNIKIIGRVGDDNLRKFYSNARVFVFPSLFEGFGLPVLEALQCGTPVVSSSTTSLPEVVGEAGILVNPEDVNGISHAIEKMLTDNDFYNKIKKHSTTQAKKFSWKKAAQETIRVYKSV